MFGYCLACVKLVQMDNVSEEVLPNATKIWKGECSQCQGPIYKNADRYVQEMKQSSSKKGRRFIWRGHRSSVAKKIDFIKRRRVISNVIPESRSRRESAPGR